MTRRSYIDPFWSEAAESWFHEMNKTRRIKHKAYYEREMWICLFYAVIDIELQS